MKQELKVLTGERMLCTESFSVFDMMVTYLPSLKLQLFVAIVKILLRMVVYIKFEVFLKISEWQNTLTAG